MPLPQMPQLMAMTLPNGFVELGEQTQAGGGDTRNDTATILRLEARGLISRALRAGPAKLSPESSARRHSSA